MNEDWEGQLQFEYLEDYIRCAEMSAFLKDGKSPEYYQEMREHFERLKLFISNLLSTQRQAIIDRLKESHFFYWDNVFEELLADLRDGNV